jgi:hypothetical protein
MSILWETDKWSFLPAENKCDQTLARKALIGFRLANS